MELCSSGRHPSGKWLIGSFACVHMYSFAHVKLYNAFSIVIMHMPLDCIILKQINVPLIMQVLKMPSQFKL